MNQIPLCIPELSGNEARYLRECVESNYVSSIGPFVARIEDDIAQVTESKFAVALSSGTAALQLALISVGVRTDDLIIVPAYTFIATANAVSHVGALPWILDIDPQTWTLRPEDVREELRKNSTRSRGVVIHKHSGKRVSAIVPVFAAGHPVDVLGFLDVADEFGIALIFDAAPGFGSKVEDVNLGALGITATYSFNGNKIITCGGGGAVISESEALAERVRHLSTTARVGSDYDHDEIGFNYRMTNVQAALGCAQIERLPMFLESKKKIHDAYTSAFNDICADQFPSASWANSSHWMSGIVLPQTGHSAPHLISALQTRGIQARRFWKPLNHQTPYLTAVTASTTNSDALWKRVVSLPCSVSLTREEQTKVIQDVRDFVSTS